MVNGLVTSVVIPCHNCASTLPLQLESLSRQVGASPFEVLVVDNCSTDRIDEVVSSWDFTFELRLIRADQFANVSYARNCGAAAARAEQLIFLDGDDAVPKRYVQYCQRAFGDGFCVFGTGFVGVGAEFFDRGLDAALRELEECGGAESTEYYPPRQDVLDPGWPILPGGGLGVTKEFFYSLGGFDMAACPGAEDNDLAIRATDLGHLPAILNATTVAYRSGGVGRTRLRQIFSRAWSVSKVRAMTGRRDAVSPIVAFIRSGLAVGNVIVGNANFGDWARRLSLQAGLAAGFIVFGVFGVTPVRKLGVGLNASGDSGI